MKCSRCDRQRRFKSSGKFRLNANGRKLDAWLVYRCDTCDNSWNRPVFERSNRNDIEPALMESLHGNDPAMAERIAHDLTRTGLKAVEAETTFTRIALPPIPDEPQRLEIRIAAAIRSGARADRLIARGLGLSRGDVHALAASGRLTVRNTQGRVLARPLRDGMVVELDLSGRKDAREIATRAAGD